MWFLGWADIAKSKFAKEIYIFFIPPADISKLAEQKTKNNFFFFFFFLHFEKSLSAQEITLSYVHIQIVGITKSVQ